MLFIKSTKYIQSVSESLVLTWIYMDKSIYNEIGNDIKHLYIVLSLSVQSLFACDNSVPFVLLEVPSLTWSPRKLVVGLQNTTY